MYSVVLTNIDQANHITRVDATIIFLPLTMDIFELRLSPLRIPLAKVKNIKRTTVVYSETPKLRTRLITTSINGIQTLLWQSSKRGTAKWWPCNCPKEIYNIIFLSRGGDDIDWPGL